MLSTRLLALTKTVTSAARAAPASLRQYSQGLSDLPLQEHDPEMFELIQAEKKRQVSGLELIASENFTSRAVQDCLSSCLTNKYAEGLPGARYYGGTQVVDKVERLCQERALKTYRLDPNEWGINVQPYSGSPANLAAMTGLLEPHDRIMGLDLPDGGHLTHGFYKYDAKSKKIKNISATSKFFTSLPYNVTGDTGIIDYDQVAEYAAKFQPRLIICGGSAYPRDWDYAKFREIADSVGAYLLCDMAHISGLVAADVVKNPFDYSDVVTTTTHKTLRGPRSGLVFFRKEYADAINFAVFPGLQGGPHMHQIAAIGTQLLETLKPEFKDYIEQVISNSQAMASALTSKGYVLATGGTDNHLILWDLRPSGIRGSKLELLCEAVDISINKNGIHGDTNSLSPAGVRIGSAALTSRGFVESDFEKVADFLEEAVDLAVEIQHESGKKLKDFRAALDGNSKVEELKGRVQEFATSFPMPGNDW